jgi:hypothetical protein
MREVVKKDFSSLQIVTIYSNMEDFAMDNKKSDKKQGKTLPVTQLPIVTLTEKDMSSVNGGGYNSWAG